MSRARITTSSGRVHVIGEARDTIDVEGARSTFDVDTDDGTDERPGETRVRGRSKSLTVRVPIGTDVVVGSESGGVTLQGSLGAVSVTTTSADIRAEDVESIDARTGSGKLSVDVSRGPVRLRTNSSRVHVGRVDGEAHIASVSGRTIVDDARGAVSAKAVSGSIHVRVTGRDRVRVETISGRIRISVPDGVKPSVRHRTVSGKPRVETEPGDDLEITARSDSGNITVGVA